MTDFGFASLLPTRNALAGGLPDALTGATLSKLPPPSTSGPRDPKAWKQAQDFEQLFMEQTLGQLTQNLSGPGPLGDEGDGSDVWRGMLTQQYAKTITQAGGLGIATTVYSELMRLQEKSSVEKPRAE